MFQNIPRLTSATLCLRLIRENDLEDLWEIYSNPIHFQMTPNTSTQNKETLRKRIGHFQRDFDKKNACF